MKIIFQFLVVFLLIFSGCAKDGEIYNEPTQVDYSENYKYFPMKKGREWKYNFLEINSDGDTFNNYFNIAKYNPNKQRLDFYSDTFLTNYFNWGNYDNKLMCCNNVTLIDYNDLNCNATSSIIYEKSDSTYSTHISQSCKRKFVKSSIKYNNIKCIKTIQEYSFSNNSSASITRFYGYNVGLIYSKVIHKNPSGGIKGIYIKNLISHNF